MMTPEQKYQFVRNRLDVCGYALGVGADGFPLEIRRQTNEGVVKYHVFRRGVVQAKWRRLTPARLEHLLRSACCR